MKAKAKKIGLEVQQLPLDDMLELHEHLVTSIHEREDAHPLDAGFRDEIKRRIVEIDCGKVQGVDPFKALEKM